MLKRSVLALALALFAANLPASAQWQVPSGAIPVGKGQGATGFNTVTGSSGAGTKCILDTNPPSFGSCISGTIPSTSVIYTPPYTGGVAETQSAYNAQRISIADFGAVGDTIVLTDGAITNGTTAFASVSATFTSGDVGKVIRVAGAGAAGGTLETTISVFVNSTHVTLTAPAGTTVTGARTYYGTDDTTKIQAALTAARGNCVLIPAKIYITTAALSTPTTGATCIIGYGASIADTVGSIILASVATDGLRILSGDTATLQYFGVFYTGAANSGTAAFRINPPAGLYNYYSRFTGLSSWNAYGGFNCDRCVSSVMDAAGFQDFTFYAILHQNALGGGDFGDNRIINSLLLGSSVTVPPVCFYWTGGGGLSFNNNKCVQSQVGVQINPGSGVNTSQIMIANNSFDGFNGAAIQFSRLDGTSSISQFTIVGNTCNLFLASTAGCVYIPVDAFGGVGLSIVSIIGNTILGPPAARTLIDINSADNVFVGGNALKSQNAGTIGVNFGATSTNVTLGAQSYTGTFAQQWQNASASYKVANGITPNTGGVIYSASDRLAVLNGTATANLPLLSQNVAAPIWATIAYPTSGTSGGIPYFSSNTVMASSGVLTSGAILVGGGAGSPPAASACSISAGNLSCGSATTFSPAIGVTNTTSDANAAQIVVNKNRSGGNTLSGDALGYFVFSGFANSAQRSAAVLQASQTAASSGSNIPSKIFVATSNTAALQNQQLTLLDDKAHTAVTAQGIAPTVTAGCNGAGFSITGGGGVANDTHGTVVGQTAAATTCTVTFGTAYTNTPDCVFSGFQSPITVVNSVSTTAFQVTFASTASYKFTYMCRGI